MPILQEKTSYDLESEKQGFEDSKAGVKGLVDVGVTKLPKMFIHENKETDPKLSLDEIPLINFEDIDEGRRRDHVVEQVKDACEKYGFFQVVNHGIPLEVLDEMVDGIRRFHEQVVDVKKKYYSRDQVNNNFFYNSNFNLFQVKYACWRDTLTFIRGRVPPSPQDLSPTCGDIMIEYTNEIMKLAETIYGLLSEALGLNTNYLKDIGCNDGIFSPCNYYPGCPEPEKTLGSTTHADSGFITILLQNHLSGLQVSYKDEWINVLPLRGALVVNMGSLMQLISNNRFVSALHRVEAIKEGPRISMACIFRTHYYPENTAKLYEPIKELLSEENPAIYGAVTVKDVISNKHTSSPGSIGNSLAIFEL